MPAHLVHRPAFYLNILFSCTLLFPTVLFAQLDLEGEDAETFAEVQERLEGVRLNPNLASVKDLQIFPWISEPIARQITTAQKRSGPFRRVDDLLNVPGLSPDLVDLLEPYLSFSTPSHRTLKTRIRLQRTSGLRLSQRSEMRLSDRVTGFVQTERDPGESTLTDFWSGYLHLTHLPGRTRLLFGDFRPGFGQGLLFSRRSRTAPGLTWAKSSLQQNAGYRSTSENNALRGLYLALPSGPFTLALIYTRTARDATIDTTGRARLYTGGRHVTPAQQARKGALKERLATLRLTGPLPGGTIGLTAGSTALTHSLSPGLPAAHQFIGLDWHIAINRYTVYGEVAKNHTQTAWLTGGQLSLKTLRLITLLRRYAPQFQSLHGAPFSALGGTNEWGLFIGAIWKPRPPTRIKTSLDRHGHLRPASETALPARGERFKLSLTHRLTRAWSLALTFSTRKQSEPSNLRLRKRLRLRLTCRLPGLRLSGWAEGSQNQSSPKQKERKAAGLSLRLGRRSGLSFSTWANLYRTTDALIYTLAPDVWDGDSLQSLTGQGKTAGVRLGWSGPHVRLALRGTLRRSQSKLTTSWTVQMDLGVLN